MCQLDLFHEQTLTPLNLPKIVKMRTFFNDCNIQFIIKVQSLMNV